MKIIQIVSYAEFECWSETPGMVQSNGDVVYGLGDNGKLYKWALKRIPLKEPRVYIDEEDGIEKKDTHVLLRGWVEEVDEIAKFEAENGVPF